MRETENDISIDKTNCYRESPETNNPREAVILGFIVGADYSVVTDKNNLSRRVRFTKFMLDFVYRILPAFEL